MSWTTLAIDHCFSDKERASRAENGNGANNQDFACWVGVVAAEEHCGKNESKNEVTVSNQLLSGNCTLGHHKAADN